MTDDRFDPVDQRTDPEIGGLPVQEFEADPLRSLPPKRKSPIGWLLLLMLIVGAACAYFLWRQYQAPMPPPLPAPAPKAEPAPAANAEPAVHYPLPVAPDLAAPTEQAQPLPVLNESDGVAKEALAGLLPKVSLDEFFNLTDIIHRLVATVDNLPRDKVALQWMPVKPAAGRFAATGQGENTAIGAQNYARYTPYVRIAESLDTRQLVAAYVHFYPLIQQAYRELGYPSGYFNDRLVAAIDDMLAAPVIQGPIALVQPKVLYQFADPALEARSAGQKIMLRIGSENAGRIKAKLREIRRAVTAPNAKQ
jgi:hypothetical protein